MRSKYRTMLTAFVAVLALGALVVSSASAALPEFRPSKGVHFTGTAGGVYFQEKGGTVFQCSRLEIEGEVVGAKEVKKMFIRFADNSKCAEFCQYPEKSDSLETRELKGTLGYIINKSTKKVGLLVEPVGGGSDVSTCYSREGFKESINGDLVIPLEGGLNVKNTKFDMDLEQVGGEQKIRKLEGETAAHQWGIMFIGEPEFLVGIQAFFEVKTAEPLEIRA